MFKIIRTILQNILVDMRGYKSDYIKITFISQGLILLLAFPLISFVLQKALNLAGLDGLTESNFMGVFNNPIGLAAFVLLIVVTVIIILLEFTLYIHILHCHQRGISFQLKDYLAIIIKKVSFLLVLQSIVLFLYLVLLIPIGGLNFISSITSGISIPQFIPMELFKSQRGTIIYFSVLAITIYINLRLMLVIHYYLLVDMPLNKAIRTSFYATKRQVLKMLFIILISGSLFLGLLGLLQFMSIIPIYIADIYFVDVAPYVASFSLAIATIITFVMVALAKVAWAHFASFFFSRTYKEAPFAVKPCRDVKAVTVWMKLALIGYCMFLVVNNASFLMNIVYDNNTLIIAHRGGNTKMAVENTVDALKAAAAYQPDYVEIDVMETADGELVVFHDETLQRLAGVPYRVADLTLEELRQIPLSANGFTAKIATLSEFAQVAKILDLKLLLEVKVYGHESQDFMRNVIEILAQNDLQDSTIIQSFQITILDEAKVINPNIRTSHIMAFNLGNIAPSDHEFITLEFASINSNLLAHARSRDVTVLAWTINDRANMIQAMVSDVGGIITGELALAVQVKEELESSQTLTAKVRFLIDNMTN